MDDRLRRRKGLEDAEISPSSNGHPGDGAQQPSGQPLCPACMGSSAGDQKALQGTHCCNANLHELHFNMAPAFADLTQSSAWDVARRRRGSQAGARPAKSQVAFLHAPSH